MQLIAKLESLLRILIQRIDCTRLNHPLFSYSVVVGAPKAIDQNQISLHRTKATAETSK